MTGTVLTVKNLAKSYYVNSVHACFIENAPKLIIFLKKENGNVRPVRYEI